MSSCMMTVDGRRADNYTDIALNARPARRPVCACRHPAKGSWLLSDLDNDWSIQVARGVELRYVVAPRPASVRHGMTDSDPPVPPPGRLHV